MNDSTSTLRIQRERSRNQAFSLLEVAFALVIFVIGAIALLRIFPGGLNVLEDSGNRRVAAQMSQNLVTSYASGDLASTTPDAIYDADTSGVWNDYPLSTLGLRRQGGTLPVGPDDLTSAKDALKHINGERQGVFGNKIYTNNIASGQIDFYREGTVSGVTVDPSGQLDFRNARYLVSNRSTLDDNPTKLEFRQPYLDEPDNVPTNNGLITLQRGAAAATFTIQWPYRTSNGLGAATEITGTAAAVGTSDCTLGPVAAGGTGLTCAITVPASNNQYNEYIAITFNPLQTSSLRRLKYICKIIGPQGESTTPPAATDITPTTLLPVRAPNQIRDNCTYYVSSSWNNGVGAAYDQPMVLPASTASTYTQGSTTQAVVPSVIAYNSADSRLLAPVRFRQELGNTASTREGSPVVVPAPTTVLDVDGQASATNITRVSLDYDVRDWEYISEAVSQFGTPYPGDTTAINTTTPEGQNQLQFQYGAGVTAPTPMPRGNLREIRTRLGNLRAPVQIKGLYSQSASNLDVTFNPRSNPQGAGTLNADQQRAYVQQANTLAKQGRLYLPAQIDNGGTTLDLSSARVYYRSRDAWAQQVGVTAPHYNLYLPNAGIIHEPWREYSRGTDGYLYFHATEAGKTVEYVHGTNIGSTQTDKLEISPDILYVTALPAGVDAAFTTTKFTKAGDPRDGKFYLARSRDRVQPSQNIYDVRRPTGTSGISVRTLWLNNDRYAQEIAE